MKNKIINSLLIVSGIVCVLLGILGIILPLLPTTPFLLLAALCFVRSSTRLNDWLLNHKILGKYIYNYTVHKSLPRKSKTLAISMLWFTMILSMIIVDKLLVTTILTTIGTAVTMHLLSLKTM